MGLFLHLPSDKNRSILEKGKIFFIRCAALEVSLSLKKKSTFLRSMLLSIPFLTLDSQQFLVQLKNTYRGIKKQIASPSLFFRN